MEETFKNDEIEDVRIIIKAKGKHYALVPKREFGKDVALQMRLLLADYALQMHAVVTPALEDINLERAEGEIINDARGLSKHAVINSVAVPEWLTDEIRAMAKARWNEHSNTNDRKRVEAMRIVQSCAKDAGYTIDIKKATELLQQHCL